MNKKDKENLRKLDFGLTDLFYYYSKTVKESMNQTYYNSVVKLFFKKIIVRLYKGDYISFPHKLGDFHINSYKPKIINFNDAYQHKGFKVTDYKATNELWLKQPELAHKVYLNYDNTHSDGIKYKLSRINSKKNTIQSLYNFLPSRQFSRGLAKFIKNNPNTEYYEC